MRWDSSFQQQLPYAYNEGACSAFYCFVAPHHVGLAAYHHHTCCCVIATNECIWQIRSKSSRSHLFTKKIMDSCRYTFVLFHPDRKEDVTSLHNLYSTRNSLTMPKKYAVLTCKQRMLFRKILFVLHKQQKKSWKNINHAPPPLFTHLTSFSKIIVWKLTIFFSQFAILFVKMQVMPPFKDSFHNEMWRDQQPKKRYIGGHSCIKNLEVKYLTWSRQVVVRGMPGISAAF